MNTHSRGDVQCAYCGRNYYHPFKCAYCGNYYCPEHRVPESHHCMISRRVMNVPNKASVKERGRWPTARWSRPQVRSSDSTERRVDRPLQSAPSHQGRRRWGLRRMGYHRWLRIRKSYIFLAIWVTGFALGLYLAPWMYYLTLIAVSLFNSVVVSIFVFGIAGIVRRGVGHKVFGVLLIMVLAGFLYQNPAVLGSINGNSLAGVYSNEAAFVSSIPASFQTNGTPNPGTSTQTNFIQSIVSEIGGPTIDAQWVTQLMATVNQARQAQGLVSMAESTSLDQLAQQRLQIETEGNHWQITHYGYQDLPPGVGEVVYYPSGYSSSDYASYLQSSAPLHWNLMMDSSFSSYGFAIGQGTTVEIYGSCPNTELPGPGINVTQFFAQEGCDAVPATSTWLVIDMS